jgi:hypothetical protein
MLLDPTTWDSDVMCARYLTCLDDFCTLPICSDSLLLPTDPNDSIKRSATLCSPGLFFEIRLLPVAFAAATVHRRSRSGVALPRSISIVAAELSTRVYPDPWPKPPDAPLPAQKKASRIFLALVVA